MLRRKTGSIVSGRTPGHGRRLRIEPLEDRRLLTVMTVDTLDDSVNSNDGLTSLREAIVATNLAGGADTIEFAASLTSGGQATIMLTQGELKVTGELTINGPGADLLTIDASGNNPTPEAKNGDGSRVFNIDDGTSTQQTVSISGLTLTGGDVNGKGGAIYSAENLALNTRAAAGNSTSDVNGNSGGAIYNKAGALTFAGGSLSGNHAGDGGGAIFTEGGTVAITNSVVASNDARYSGGALFNYIGDVTVDGGTLSQNLANFWGGAMYSYSGTATFTDVTINDNSTPTGTNHNGGAIYNQSTQLTINGGELGGNYAGDGGGGIFTVGATVNLNDTTVYSNRADFSGGAILISGGSLTGLRSSLQNNTAGLLGGAIFNYAATLFIGDSTVSGNHSEVNGGAVYTSAGGATYLEDSTVSDNSAERFGGALVSLQSLLSLTNCIVNDNFTPDDGGNSGGAIDAGGSNLSITDSTFLNNHAGDGGGAIYGVDGTSMIISGSTISGNSARYSGGGIFNADGDLTLEQSKVDGNTGSYAGAGLYLDYALAWISQSTVSNNSLGVEDSRDGGGIYAYNTQLAVIDSTISGNTAYEGGGVFSDGDLIDYPTTITNSTISGNTATLGSALYNNWGLATILYSTITNNSSPGSGSNCAGVYSTGDLSITRTEVGSSIIAGNPSDDRDVAYDSHNTFVSLGYNLIGGGNANAAFDQAGDTQNVADPLLAPLSDNGGPTWTHALLPGSPAFDNGDPGAVSGVDTVPLYDQRGGTYYRIVGERIDIGAFEWSPSTVAGRFLFYNQSGTSGTTVRYDGNSLAINSLDDNAIAIDKVAYLPSAPGAATFANISSYSKGINGIMVDISGSHPNISADDFEFHVGNSNSPSGWSLANPPTSVSVRAGAGVSGSDRVEIIWNSGAPTKQWLEVAVLATADTGLTPLGGGYTGARATWGDVFYFGNALGNTGLGDTSANATVNATDEGAIRLNPQVVGNNIPITNIHDVNRDAKVDATDQAISRLNATNSTTVLKYLNLADPPAAPEGDGGAGVASALTALSPAAPAAVPRWLGLRLDEVVLNSGRVAEVFQNLHDWNSPTARNPLVRAGRIADALSLDHELLDTVLADLGLE